MTRNRVSAQRRRRVQKRLLCLRASEFCTLVRELDKTKLWPTVLSAIVAQYLWRALMPGSYVNVRPPHYGVAGMWQLGRIPLGLQYGGASRPDAKPSHATSRRSEQRSGPINGRRAQRISRTSRSATSSTCRSIRTRGGPWWSAATRIRSYSTWILIKLCMAADGAPPPCRAMRRGSPQPAPTLLTLPPASANQPSPASPRRPQPSCNSQPQSRIIPAQEKRLSVELPRYNFHGRKPTLGRTCACRSSLPHALDCPINRSRGQSWPHTPSPSPSRLLHGPCLVSWSVLSDRGKGARDECDSGCTRCGLPEERVQPSVSVTRVVLAAICRKKGPGAKRSRREGNMAGQTNGPAMNATRVALVAGSRRHGFRRNNRDPRSRFRSVAPCRRPPSQPVVVPCAHPAVDRPRSPSG